MGLSRVLRRWVSSALVLAIVFAQIATAAHACPFIQPGSDDSAQAMARPPCAEMVSADAMPESGQSDVCRQHCQFGANQQQADSAPWLPVPASPPALLFVLAPALEANEVSRPQLQRQRQRERGPPLAHSIAHCCYRL